MSSVLTGTLTRVFELDGELEGRAVLDVPSQSLRYDLQWRDLLEEEILDIKLHREDKDSAGPVVALLGKSRRGEIAVRNEDLDALLGEKLYFTVYTREAPLGAARARIVGASDPAHHGDRPPED